MRNMSRFWMMLVVGAALGATLLGVSPVKAAPLTKNNISWSNFLDFADIDNPVVPELFQTFDFDPTTPGGDGEIFSQVFPGIGSAKGKYVYVYQIDHFQESSSPELDEMAFIFLTTLPPEYPSGTSMAYFNITSGDPTIGFGELGSQPAYLGEFTSSNIGFKFEGNGDSGLLSGEISHIFGFIHPLPPTTIVPNLVDGGPDLLKPLVYTPSPEPSSAILAIMGLLGIVGFGWRRRRCSEK